MDFCESGFDLRGRHCSSSRATCHKVESDMPFGVKRIENEHFWLGIVF